MQRSKAGWISLIGIYLGLGLVLFAVYEIFQTQSDKYWPVLVIGMVFGFASTPFYYYFKTRDRQATNTYEIAAITLAKAVETPPNHENFEEIKKNT